MSHGEHTSALFKLSIPSPDGQIDITLKAGSSIIFVGANGSGKTRLSEYIETDFKLRAHRISAHRAQSLNPNVSKISEEKALAGLRTGDNSENTSGKISRRRSSRWRGRGAVAQLNDYDHLLQVLFADQANVSLETHRRKHVGGYFEVKFTKFQKLEEIWEDLLPERKLEITGDNIEVLIGPGDEPYSASEMSDGERAIFYLIGQTLAAANDSLLIIDEPELHVHHSIMSKLWDRLEGARPDCAFVFVTHDLEFATSRVGQKYVVNSYRLMPPSPHNTYAQDMPQWRMQLVPEDSGFDEEVTTLILGSRKPILFVEGSDTSLDKSIYRNCFPDRTIIPRGSCEVVIRSVQTMQESETLTRVDCKGIVDADDRDEEEIKRLEKKGISALKVSEIENIILLPKVSRAIAESNEHMGVELDKLLEDLQDDIFADAKKNLEEAVKRYCCRRISRLLKKIDLSGKKSVNDIESEYKRLTGELDIQKIAQLKRKLISNAIEKRDLKLLLENYDNKGLLAIAAGRLKDMRKTAFCNWLSRNLDNKEPSSVLMSIRKSLPKICSDSVRPTDGSTKLHPKENRNKL